MRGRQLYVTMVGFLVLAAILIGISGIPRFKNGSGIDGMIGGIGWFGACSVRWCFSSSRASRSCGPCADEASLSARNAALLVR
jgi:hypothetical protein